MPISWRIFLVVEALIFAVFIWQLISYPANLVFIILGILCLIWGNKRKRSGKSNFMTNVLVIMGGISVAVPLLINFTLWLMLIVGILFLALNRQPMMHFKNTNLNHFFSQAPWQKQDFVPLDTKPPHEKNGQVKRHAWFGSETIGTNVFEWDDINFNVIAGDTIIDLGSTILPKTDSVIIIRKGIGKTRILVPIGTGVALEHAALIGNLTFNEQQYHLKNESLKLYSENYDEETRHLKIVTNVAMGDLEVIFV